MPRASATSGLYSHPKFTQVQVSARTGWRPELARQSLFRGSAGQSDRQSIQFLWTPNSSSGVLARRKFSILHPDLSFVPLGGARRIQGGVHSGCRVDT